MEYYLAFKRKEILTHVTTRTKLTVSERSQSQKENTVQFNLHEVSRLVKFIETESRMMVAKG